MKLACSDFTWPLLPHDRVLKLIGMLDLAALDLGVFAKGSHLKPDEVRRDIPLWAGVIRERLGQSGLALADVFVQPSGDFAVMAPNNPDPAQQEDAAAFFRDMLDFARRLDAPGMTMLPGVRFGGESWDASIRRSAEAFKWRVDAAAEAGLRLSVEGHLGSNVDTPEKLAQLVELTPGLTLTLDYGHFTYQGIPDSAVEPLLDHARHFHCRGGAKERLQTKFQDNTIDFGRVVARMNDIGYDGYVAIEYTWQDWQGCNETENTCETIQFRDYLRSVDIPANPVA